MAPRREVLVTTVRSTHPQDAPPTTAKRDYLYRSSPLVKTLKKRSLQPNYPSVSSPISGRPVLVPLHQNLRRLPSRARLTSMPVLKDSDLHLDIGRKRKRVASGTENVARNGYHAHPRVPNKNRTVSGRRFKRRKSLRDSDTDKSSDAYGQSGRETDEDSLDEMEVDEYESSQNTTTDDFLLTSAPVWRLLQLRKDELVRLHDAQQLFNTKRARDAATCDTDALTKQEIVTLIMEARDSQLPPSSAVEEVPATSDDEEYNASDAEECEKIQRPIIPLRRRATDNSVPVHHAQLQTLRSTTFKPFLRPTRERTFSLGNLISSDPRNRGGDTKGKKRGSSSLSSNDSIASPITPPQRRNAGAIPATGRKRKASGSKSKQVDFVDTVAIASSASDDSDPSATNPNPSPRRLRSRDRQQSDLGVSALRGPSSNEFTTTLARRITPMRNAKRNASNLVESSDVGSDEEFPVEGDEDEEVGEAQPEPVQLRRSVTEIRRALRPRPHNMPSEPILPSHKQKQIPKNDEKLDGPSEESSLTEESTDSSDENDDISAPSIPIKERLRPRKQQDGSAPDEESDDAADDEETETEQDEESGSAQDVEEILEPRRLRNGKIVGEDGLDADEMEVSEDDSDAACDIEVVQEEEEDGDDEDADGEAEDEEEEEDDESADDDGEASDIDVDLSDMNLKALVQFRKDDLVKLCLKRELSDRGTKKTLSRRLLRWQDEQMSTTGEDGEPVAGPQSDSSIKTVRPRSTGSATGVQKGVKQQVGQKGKSRSNEIVDGVTVTPATPLLLRKESSRDRQIHALQPRTPTPASHVVNSSGAGTVPSAACHNSREKDNDELELDLESLGLEDREIPPEKLTKMEKIGSGGFKDVFVGKLRGRLKVAISEFRSQLTPMDIKELKLLSDFDHPNVVRFLGVSIPENSKETPVMIVSELCPNGDLFDYIRNVPPPTLHKVIGLMLDVGKGVEYLHLHKPSIIHRDCKSSNILITAKVTAKITDFGLAKVKQSTRSMVRSLVGTVNWQAPELWSPHPKYNHKVDVFSCACVFWEMLQWHTAVKKFPWEGMNEHAIYDAVGAKKQRPSLTGLRKLWCPEVVDLIERMWAQEPSDRPTMTEVVEELERLHDEY